MARPNRSAKPTMSAAPTKPTNRATLPSMIANVEKDGATMLIDFSNNEWEIHYIVDTTTYCATGETFAPTLRRLKKAIEEAQPSEPTD